MIARALEAEILRLHHAEHWPIGTIAAQLRVHHSTVRRVLAQAGVAVTKTALRASIVAPYMAFIVETLAKYPTLRASRLHTMVRERGYTGAPDHFRAIVARLRPRPVAEAYLRLRTLPGEQAMNWSPFNGRHEARRALSTDGRFGRLRRTRNRPAVGNAAPHHNDVAFIAGSISARQHRSNSAGDRFPNAEWRRSVL